MGHSVFALYSNFHFSPEEILFGFGWGGWFGLGGGAGLLVHFFRIIKNQGGGASPKTPSPPPQTKVTIVGKNEIYNSQNLVRPFLVHQVLGPKPPPPLPPPAQKKPWGGSARSPPPPPHFVDKHIPGPCAWGSCHAPHARCVPPPAPPPPASAVAHAGREGDRCQAVHEGAQEGHVDNGEGAAPPPSPRDPCRVHKDHHRPRLETMAPRLRPSNHHESQHVPTRLASGSPTAVRPAPSYARAPCAVCPLGARRAPPV